MKNVVKPKNVIDRALEDAGIPREIIKRGDVWLITDSIITFPTDRLPRSKRTTHDKRPVLVLSCDDDLANIRPLTAIISPFSTIKDKAVTDFMLHAGTAGLKEDSIVRLGLVQPILKTDLKEKIGNVDSAILDQIITVLLCNLGVLQRSRQ